MPILGIYASQNYPRITNSFESIATVTVGSGGSSSISFTSIPSTYKHLQLRGITRGATTTYFWNDFKFNSDATAANYSFHAIRGDGASASASGGGSNNSPYWDFPHASGGGTSTLANTFAVCVIDILDYANTSKNKTMRTLAGYDANGSGQIAFTSNGYFSTNAINAISFSANVAEFTTWALYGIKG